MATPLLDSSPYENGKNLLTDLYLACLFLAQRSLTATHILHKTMRRATNSTRDSSTIRTVSVLLWGAWMVMGGGTLVTKRAGQGGEGRSCDSVEESDWHGGELEWLSFTLLPESVSCWVVSLGSLWSMWSGQISSSLVRVALCNNPILWYIRCSVNV